MRVRAQAVASPPESTISRTAAATSFSSRLWDIDWSARLPWVLDGVSVERGTFADDGAPFMKEHYRSIFPPDARFFAEAMGDAKRRFFEEADVFVFRADERPIGICIAHPTDWSTYYVRTLAILPEFQDRRVFTDFHHQLSAALREAGVVRLEGETSPVNAAVNRMFIRQGFILTSTTSSERWGTMLRFTKFLSEEAEATFRKQFIYAPISGETHTNERRAP